jgi:mRNA-degrading endonuclease RelE of RelBE toxin-antitoxin system
MNHFTVPSFWESYNKLPDEIKKIADKNFEFLKKNPNHPSLHLKKVNKYWSVRVGNRYRALAVEIAEGLLWFWIGSHSQYDNFFKR